MKVLFVTRSMWAGGAERVIAELVKHFTKMKIKCEILTIDDENILYDIPKEAKIYPIGEVTKNKLLDKFLRYKKVRKLVKDSKPDVVLALPEDIGIYVIPSLLGINVPVIISERNNPWVMPWKKETRFLRKLFYPFANGFIFQTKDAANYFPDKIKEKSIILPNPLDLKQIPSINQEKRKEIIGAGRLDKQKNFPLLIRAFAKFYKNNNDYVLTIYGDGALKNELEDLASSLLPQDSFQFPGRKADLLEHISGGSMFVLSSDYEGMPNVVIEAMAMGIPVISTDCPTGGPAELIDDGVNGLLVPVGDLDSMTQAMSKIAKSKSLARNLGLNALKIRDRLDTNVVSEKWIEYIKFVKSNKV
ncbi:glycosyltransferase family 4 protein [Halobacillus kuroshimensis]|uniref:glycosyltransferase family 4 protein n=1 Tax=Halobacillus kuroshimensis TaxID=302481 RepID=UPI000429B908|nr:glycosyltransferase family 4 protein [Halobacillus kuroshimensis]